MRSYVFAIISCELDLVKKDDALDLIILISESNETSDFGSKRRTQTDREKYRSPA